jgi:hypothetical protein
MQCLKGDSFQTVKVRLPAACHSDQLNATLPSSLSPQLSLMRFAPSATGDRLAMILSTRW